MKKTRVLCVDDQELIRHIVREILAKHTTIELWTAATGEEAKQLINDFEIDIFVLDLILPGVSGWELIDAIREQPNADDKLIVVMSGATMTVDEKKRLQNTVDVVLPKEEFEVNRFNRVVSDLVKQKAALNHASEDE